LKLRRAILWFVRGPEGRPDSPLIGQGAGNPQSWNLYTYVLNNPLSYSDPSGHYCPAAGCDPPPAPTLQPPSGGGGLPISCFFFPWLCGGGGVGPGDSPPQQQPPPPRPPLPASQLQTPTSGIKAKVCRVIPTGRTLGASGGIGGIGSVGGGGELVVNYNTGQVSAFGFGGFQGGWNGGLSGSAYTGFIYGLNNSNSNYSAGFTGVNGGAGLGGFAASSSGGLTGGPSGLVPNGSVTVKGVSFGGGLLGGFSGGVTATNYTNPLQLGKIWAFEPVDLLLYSMRQACR
jgi:hypothetical protein